MLKLTVGMLAVVLAGSASAAGWRSMRIDASSEDTFNESVTALKDKLPRVRREVFERSLQDIWLEGMKAAQADGRDYTVTDYLWELDGLGYKEVVIFTDPSGDTADRYWDRAYVSLRGNVPPLPGFPPPSPGLTSNGYEGPAGGRNTTPVNPWER
jgi:hypothetical protein